MANIDQYLDEIEVASRGEEVRDSIIDAFEALNSEGPGTMDWDNITDTPDTLTGYGVSEVPASMVSGVLALNNIPPSALERVVPVADDAARFALTSSDVQNGDTVKVLSTLKLYLVVDDTSLSTEAGYEEYRAGTADSVDWSGVLNTPDTLAGYGIEDAYTKDEVDDITTSEEVESDVGNPIVIETDAAQYAKATHLTLAPVQDLHGYDHPWPAGGGKNKLNNQAASATISNVTYTVASDGSVATSGTSDSWNAFNLGAQTLPAGEYILSSGVPLAHRFNQFISGTINGVTYETNQGDVTFTLEGETTFTVGIVTRPNTAPNQTVYPMIRLASESDATFAPYSNICPISGLDEVEVKVTGKNLLNIDDVSNGYNLDTNTGLPVALSGRCCLMEPIDVKNISRVAISFTSNVAETFVIYALLKDGVLVDRNPGRTSGMTIDTTNGDELYLCWYVTNGNVDKANLSNVQVELGSTATDYEPYTESVSSLDLPEEVYSGTLDLETGEVVVDKAYEEFSGNETTYEKQRESHIHVGYIPLSNSAKDSDTATTESAIFDKFKTITKNYDAYVEGDGEIYNSRAYFFVPNASDATDVKNYVQSIGGFTVCYELATPITYQLTPQQLALFKGVNNISTNAKTVQVTYRNGELATTGNIVDAVEVAKQNAIGESASYTDARLATELAPILGNFATAETSPTSASHAVGEYLLYNKRLYKVLAAISAGQQLTIGTNVGQTNVAAELASQASAISALNENIQKSVYYTDAQVSSLGGFKACVQDAVTNAKVTDGVFLGDFTAGTRYLMIGMLYNTRQYGTILLYSFGNSTSYRAKVSGGTVSLRQFTETDVS